MTIQYVFGPIRSKSIALQMKKIYKLQYVLLAYPEGTLVW